MCQYLRLVTLGAYFIAQIYHKCHFWQETSKQFNTVCKNTEKGGVVRNYVKSTKHILALFDQECEELAYTDFIPNKVLEARKKMEAEKTPDRMEIVKERVMHSLRNAFNPDLYDLKKTSYSPDGERA